MDSNNDLFSASLDAIDSSKRVEKFESFFTKFRRECNVTLDNAQEWIKAELPLVASYIEIAPLKEELKSSKITERRKHLLSALIFEQAAREAVRNHQAATAGIMAMHMLNHVWQAKLEMHEFQPAQPHTKNAAHNIIKSKSKAEQEHDLKREQILTRLIKKGEQQKIDSQIQSQKKSNTSIKARPKQQPVSKKKNVFTKTQKDLWTEAAEKERLNKLKAINKKNATDKKKKRNAKSVFSKVRTKFPLSKKSKNGNDLPPDYNDSNAAIKKPHDSLLDDPNRSAIMVSPGLIKDIDDSLIQARPRFSDNPNESGITVRKVLKKREHDKHEPGSNTIIMKLASSAGKGKTENLSVPEQCQEAVNHFCAMFPGYDMVAIRNLAAEKVGVSPQYIENLNILPENT